MKYDVSKLNLCSKMNINKTAWINAGNIIINSSDIESCHRFPLRRNSTTDNKYATVKFVNRKHSQLMLRSKKSIISKN